MSGGESGYIRTTGCQIHPELAQMLPSRSTTIRPLTSIEGTHLYYVEVRGFTIALLVSIMNAYLRGKFDDATALISQCEALEV